MIITLDYDDDACKPLCQTFPGTLTPCKQAVASYAAPIAPQVFEGIRSGAWLLEGSCLSLGGQGKKVKKVSNVLYKSWILLKFAK